MKTRSKHQFFWVGQSVAWALAAAPVNETDPQVPRRGDLISCVEKTSKPPRVRFIYARAFFRCDELGAILTPPFSKTIGPKCDMLRKDV